MSINSWSLRKMKMYFRGLSAMNIDISKMPPQATHILQYSGNPFCSERFILLANKEVKSWKEYVRGMYCGRDENLKGIIYWFVTEPRGGESKGNFVFVVETYGDYKLSQYMGFMRAINGDGEFEEFSVESELFDLVMGHEQVH